MPAWLRVIAVNPANVQTMTQLIVKSDHQSAVPPLIPDVAVREMIQNGHDTCIIRQSRDNGFRDPRIDISFDKAAQTLTFSDNGAGMTEDELHKYLSTIAEIPHVVKMSRLFCLSGVS